MTETELLRHEINELKATVQRLQDGETRILPMSTRLQRERRRIFEEYFGKWYPGTQVAIGNNDPRWPDYNELQIGLQKLANITYKTAGGYNGKNITSVIIDQKSFEEYSAVYEYFCMAASEKILILSAGMRKNK